MKTLKYPLALDGAGRAVVSSVETQIWRDRISVLLSTMPGERPEDLTYGARVSSALFETPEDTERILREIIEEALQRWLPEITLLDAVIVADETNDSQVVLTLTFSATENVEDTLTTVIDITE